MFREESRDSAADDVSEYANWTADRDRRARAERIRVETARWYASWRQRMVHALMNSPVEKRT